MLRLLLALTVMWSSVKGDIRPCDADWIYNDGLCYWSSFFEQHQETTSPLADWFGAELKCRSMESNLAYVEDVNNHFEMSLIQSLVNCGPSWLGLVESKIFSESNWVWWRNNQVSHLNRTYGHDQNCSDHTPSAAVLMDFKVMVDFPDALFPFVCIKDANRQRTDTCDNSSIGYLDDNSTCCQIPVRNPHTFSPKIFYANGRCYLSANEAVDYFAAQLTCQENNMHLPSIHNENENKIVGMVSMCKSSWIGLENIVPRDICTADGWAWEDETTFSFVNNWFNGGRNAPRCNDTTYQNVFIDKHHNFDGTSNEYDWFSAQGADLYPFNCVLKN